MHSYYELQLLANHTINERMAEAGRERLCAEARRAHAGARRGASHTLLARFLRVRIRPDRPAVLSLEKTCL